MSGSTSTGPLAPLNSGLTTVAEFGLAAALRERVQAGGLTGGTSALTPAQALAMAEAIVALPEWSLSSINAAIASVVADTALTAGGSFGSHLGVIRMLAGYTFRVPKGVNVTSGGNFVLSGSRTSRGLFLKRSESGFRDVPVHIFNGEALASLAEGDLKVLKTGMALKNPAFAYTDAEVTAWRPRALTLAGTPIPADGFSPVIRVIDAQGSVY